MGIMKAAVFPEPVGAHARTSRPWMCTCVCGAVCVCVCVCEGGGGGGGIGEEQKMLCHLILYSNELHGLYLLCLSL